MDAQAEEILQYRSAKYYLRNFPLDIYLKEKGIGVHQLVKGRSKECRRGYQGEWEVRADQLYLTELYDIEGKDLIGRLFQSRARPIPAVWFTGTIRASKEHGTSNDNGVGSLMLEVHKGVVRLPQEASTTDSSGIIEMETGPANSKQVEVPHAPEVSQGRSTTCEPLLRIATPDLFRENAFRITGLPVEATLREITKHADKLKMMEEFGAGRSMHAGAFALDPPPSIDQIRGAIQRLKDPELRMLDELFWFWPRQGGQSGSDSALRALEGGDSGTALQIWTSLETSPTEGIVAMHNVAVLWHLIALDWEIYYETAGEVDDKRWQEVEPFWQRAFERWQLLAADDIFWERVRERVLQVGDPRLTTGFVRRLRVTLPSAVAKVNAELAVRHLKKGLMDRARKHAQSVRGIIKEPSRAKQTVETVLAPIVTRLRHQIQQTQERAKADPSIGVNACRDLLSQAGQPLALFDLFYGDSRERNELADELAVLSNILQVACHKATSDEQPCLDLLRQVLPLATSSETRQRIEANIGVLTGLIQQKQLQPIYTSLEKLHESKELPTIRFHRFRTEIVPRLQAVSGSTVGSESHTILSNFAAVVLRDQALNAWNAYQDHATALAATKLALLYALDQELRQRLDADLSTLKITLPPPPRQPAPQKEGLKPAAPTPNPEPASKSGCLALALILGGAFFLIGILTSTPSGRINTAVSSSASGSASPTPPTSDSPPPSTGYTAPSVGSLQPVRNDVLLSNPHFDLPSSSPSFVIPTPHTPPAFSSITVPGTYRVPNSRTPELERERVAVEQAKLQLDRSSSSLKLMARQIESARLLLDSTSQADVDAFNRKVDRYNVALEQQREQQRTVNGMVDDYNAKLQIYSH